MIRASAVALLAVVLTACLPPRRAGVGDACELNSACDAPLVCRLGYCRNECASAADCAAGLSCVLDARGLGACQLPPETSCAVASECPEGLVCRFRACTNPCVTDRDCPGGARCEMDTEGLACVDRSGTPCVLDETCDPRATGERCVSGRCRRECFSDRDCRNDFRCSEGLCHPPVDGMDASTDASETDAPSPSACGGGPLANVGDLSTGRLHACAVTDLGAGSRVWCWGAIPGVLGGAPCAREMTSLATLGVIDVTAGGDHTCARTAAGEVLCAGGVFTSDAATFVSVATDSAEIEAGASHTCSRTNAGVVECFGSGAFGVLGTGSSTSSSVPVPVTVVDTSLPFGLGMGRAFSCAIGRGDRQVACWGDDSFGQLGNGGGAPLVGVEEVDGGGEHTCARTLTTLHCWGHNSAGQLGVASPTMRSTRDVVPLPAGGLRGIAAGNFHTCVDLDGDAHCWGLGRAIDGSAGSVLTPTRLLVGIHGLDAGDDYTCGIDGTGHVVCVGGNSDGELGDGTSADRYVPIQVLTE